MYFEKLLKLALSSLHYKPVGDILINLAWSKIKQRS